MSVSDLSKMTGVSEVTIRQDLNTLEKQSYLRRTHGFAVPLDSDDVETRMMNNYTVKRELADYAASLVSDGETVLSKTVAAMRCWPVALVSNWHHHHHRQQLYRALA
jgi:DeoR/GlpR family transcriptional regulator of sugar metabolism